MKNPFRSATEQRAAPAPASSGRMPHKQLDMIARVIAKTVVPLEKRIFELEKALEVEIAKDAKALSDDVGAFLDDLTPGERRAMEATKAFHAKGGTE